MSKIRLPNGHNLKLIATDMDGTLLQSDRTIEKRTLGLLKELQGEGIRLVLISGRPIRGMIKYGKELDFEKYDGTLIGINGGQAYSMKDKQDIWRYTLDVNDAARYFKAWQPFGLDHLAYGQDVIYLDSPRLGQEKGGPSDLEGGKSLGSGTGVADKLSLELGDDDMGAEDEERALIKRLEAITGKDIELRDLTKPLEEAPTKVCVYGPRDTIIKGLEVVRRQVEDKLYGAFSADTYYEAMLRGINKGTGLQEYADSLGILPEEIIAFGDHDNDIPMLAYAGVGVAMERASAGLVDQANYMIRMAYMNS